MQTKLGKNKKTKKKRKTKKNYCLTNQEKNKIEKTEFKTLQKWLINHFV